MSKLLSMIRSKVKYLQLKKIGNPTIIDGAVSGFTVNDYLNFDMTQKMLQQYVTKSEIVMKVKLPNDISTNQQILWLAYNGSSTGFQLITNQKVRWFVTANQPEITPVDTVTLNTDLWIKGLIKNNIATLYFSTDGINWINKGNANMLGTEITLSQKSRIGVNSLTWAFLGTIYIPQCYIKLGNTKYIFTLP